MGELENDSQRGDLFLRFKNGGRIKKVEKEEEMGRERRGRVAVWAVVK